MFESASLQEQINAAREPEWLVRCVNQLVRTPGKRRTMLRQLIGHPPRFHFSEDWADQLASVQAYFDRMNEKKRRKFWSILFPKIADHLEQAWLRIGDKPYQTGYRCFPYRAPNHGGLIATNRAAFFKLISDSLHGLDQDITWIASRAPWLPGGDFHSSEIAWLLATALRQGGADADSVRSVLIDSINGEHEVGEMGSHCIGALLNSDQRSEWEVIGKLLLAAQRQEGLRQSILEAVHEAHPDAFRYMLGLILEHDLGRFSATVRAFDVWLGLQWSGGSTKVVHQGVRRLIEYFDDESARDDAIVSGKAEDTYLALWMTAFLDAEKAIDKATPILEDEAPERRFVALRMLANIAIFPESLEPIADRLITRAEKDPRLQMAIMNVLARIDFLEVPDELFDACAKLFEQVPLRAKTLEPIVWPWEEHTHDRRTVANALRALAAGSPERLIPFAPSLDTSNCLELIHVLAGLDNFRFGLRRKKKKRRKLTAEGRKLMLTLIGDRRVVVQQTAFQAIEDLPVQEDEVEVLVAQLHRNAPVLRANAVERFTRLKDAQAVEVIERLISDENAKKQAAGLELANRLIESERSGKTVKAIVEAHRDALTEPELAEAAKNLLDGPIDVATLDDCLGLVPPGSRSKLPEPRYMGVTLETNGARACLRSLAELLLEHAEMEVEVQIEGASGRELLGSLGWMFPHPEPVLDPEKDARERLPLCDVWLDWLRNRPAELRDDDGLELVRAWAWSERDKSFIDGLPAPFKAARAMNLTDTYEQLWDWMVRFSTAQGASELLVQNFEDVLARKKWRSPGEKRDAKREWFFRSSVECRRRAVAREFLRLSPKHVSPESKQRFLVLCLLAMERKVEDCEDGPTLQHFVCAYDAGLVNAYDFIWFLLAPDGSPEQSHSYSRLIPLTEVSGAHGSEAIASRPQLLEAVGKIRKRLVELELARGECTIVASYPASMLRYAGGAEVLFKLVTALGRDKLARQFDSRTLTRAISFSRLIAVTAPGGHDSYQDFAKRYAGSSIKPARLLEVAMFAPQWAGHVEATLDRPGLQDAVWWIHAHTKQSDYWRGEEFRNMWVARVSERTELDADDLEQGAVDVAWFHRVIDRIGIETWDQLEKPARYASNSGGHKRAQLFADAMLSRVTVDALLERINGKRHQDAVRALGLLPLPDDPEKRKAETLKRYQRMQEFKRESRKFGSQRQASEGRAVDIGMQNLARTAGYRDPRRLRWAMEAEAVADLAQGPVEVTVEETTVSLAISDAGDPELTVTKRGKRLKNVPAKLRKNEPVAELRSRMTDLRRQRSRMRLALEDAMCRGDEFTADEIREFFAHPMLRPMVTRLVFIGGDDLVGYPDKDGKVLRDHDGKLEPIGTKNSLRIAHPIDLLHRGDWSAWQRDCFAAERVQPFKQIFRETYPKTAGELEEGAATRRYAGHQLNPAQALALLRKRQWVFAPEEGVRKTFHDEGLIAELWFPFHFYTPAEIEDLTLESISFIRRRSDRYERVSIADVPDRLFSEVMRDMDLVVSVAHAGGVDPEATASTVEMRATLVRETCRLLRLANVRIDGHHVKIDGTRGSYAVHLGSASTQLIPGKMLLIVAVHSQYRGRLFLPFADDDPRTAEVLAKVLLLARDAEIKDPNILDQIRH